MAWNAGLHPRAAPGTAAGGQFAAGGSSASQKKPKPKAAPKSKTSAMKPKAATKVRSSRSKSRGRTVTVKRGDTLSGIARRSGESLSQLKKDNPGLFSKSHRGGNLIFPGNKVKLAGAKKSRVKASAVKGKKTGTLKPKPKAAAKPKATAKPKAAPKVRSTTTKKAAPPRMTRGSSTTRRSSGRVVSRGGGVSIARKRR